MVAVAAPLVPGASAQVDAAFEFSPNRSAPGTPIEIVARCVQNGSPAGVQFLVQLEQNEGSFNHRRTYLPEPDGSVRNVFDIPADAPPGDYFFYGSCFVNRVRVFRHTGVFHVSPPPTTTGARTEVRGKSVSRSDDTTQVLRILVILAAIGSAALVGYGEWSRRRPGGNHHR